MKGAVVSMTTTTTMVAGEENKDDNFGGGYGDITTMRVELFPKDTDMLIYDGVLMRTWPHHSFLILKQLAKSLKLL